MPANALAYVQMAEDTTRKITGSYQEWTTAFLQTAARLYKYPFHEQLMIYAQRPDATACADYQLWNNTMRRYVRRGSKGIALIDQSGDIPRIRYVFDVSDTGRIEDSRPPAAGWKNGFLDARDAGIDWLPGMPSEHKSLKSFQTELKEKYGILLSSCKIRKILISGGVWTTERSREVQALFSLLTSGTEDEPALKPDKAIQEISRRLEISRVMVTVNLPYSKGVNGLEDKSKNAIRCANYRRRKAEKQIEG